MVFLRNTLECSLIYNFLTIFDFVCMSGIKDVLKKTQKWSDSEGSVADRSESLRPFVITSSRECPYNE